MIVPGMGGVTKFELGERVWQVECACADMYVYICEVTAAFHYSHFM